MKNFKLILIFLIAVSCNSDTLNSATLDSTSTSTTEYIDPLLVSSYETLPEAVVRIEVKSSQAEINEDLEIELFEYEGSGSGFFISDDGYIVTNNHVVSGAVTIDVYTENRNQPYKAKLVGSSECDDIAILKIDTLTN